MTVSDLAQTELRRVLRYEPEDGLFTWLVRKGRAGVGSTAGNRITIGYIGIGIDGTKYYAHRLAFLYMNGQWPADQVDHINGCRDDNRWSNLRLATDAQNKYNMKIPSHNTSGEKGVYWNWQRGLWEAHITKNDRHKLLGAFLSKEDAATAYLHAANRLFGNFASDGKQNDDGAARFRPRNRTAVFKGACKHPYHGIWSNMIARCTQPNATGWENQGGRGIRVCDRWRYSFAAFLQDMGERPDSQMLLQRIDVDGHYEPGNCRWASRQEQMASQRSPWRSGTERRARADAKLQARINAAKEHLARGETLSQTARILGIPRPNLDYALRGKAVHAAKSARPQA